MAEPIALGEHSLEDDVRARTHSSERLGGRLPCPLLAVARRDLHDAQSLRTQVLEVVPLVLEPLARR